MCRGIAQVEIDYKAECMAGQVVESLGSRVQEDTNGTGILRYGLDHHAWTGLARGFTKCASIIHLPLHCSGFDQMKAP